MSISGRVPPGWLEPVVEFQWEVEPILTWGGELILFHINRFGIWGWIGVGVVIVCSLLFWRPTSHVTSLVLSGVIKQMGNFILLMSVMLGLKALEQLARVVFSQANKLKKDLAGD